MNHEELRTHVVELARTAGDRVRELYERGGSAPTQKEDGTPITEADLASEAVLMAGLAEIHAVPILSEETKAAPFAERCRWSEFWLVDPLDGTKEFVNRTDEFAVIVALVSGGVPSLGVIHAPMLETTWSAVRGGGAYVSSTGSERRLGPRTPPRDRTALVSRSHRSGGSTDRYLERLGVERCEGVGSAIKFGRMAEGEAHLYLRLGPTMEWDVAAGDCLCREQGLEVVSVPSGVALPYNTETLVNPPFVVRDPKDASAKTLPGLD